MAQYQPNPNAIAEVFLSCFKSTTSRSPEEPSSSYKTLNKSSSSSNKQEIKKTCTFCGITKSNPNFNIIYEDEKFLAFKDRSPGSKHHILLIPKLHITNVKNLIKDDLGLVTEMARIGTGILNELNIPIHQQRMGFHIPPFYSIDHLHLHLLSLPLNFTSKLKYFPSLIKSNTSNQQKRMKEKVKGISFFIEVNQVIKLLENDSKIKISSCFINKTTSQV